MPSKLLFAALAFILASPACADPCTTNCTLAFKIEAKAMCHAGIQEIASLKARGDALADLNRQYIAEIYELREELERLKKARPQKATAAPRAAKALPCKKGRHRNAKGICGRW